MRAVCPGLRPVFSPGGLSPRRKRAGCAAAGGCAAGRGRRGLALRCARAPCGGVSLGPGFLLDRGSGPRGQAHQRPGGTPARKAPLPRRAAAEALPQPCRCVFRRGTPRFRQAALRFFSPVPSVLRHGGPGRRRNAPRRPSPAPLHDPSRPRPTTSSRPSTTPCPSSFPGNATPCRFPRPSVPRPSARPSRRQPWFGPGPCRFIGSPKAGTAPSGRVPARQSSLTARERDRSPTGTPGGGPREASVAGQTAVPAKREDRTGNPLCIPPCFEKGTLPGRGRKRGPGRRGDIPHLPSGTPPGQGREAPCFRRAFFR